MFRKIFIHSPIRYIVAVVIDALVVVLSIVPNPKVPYQFMVSFSTAGAVTILFGLLVLLANFGAFDMFSYAFLSLRKANRDTYKDLYQYSQIKKEKRSKHMFTFIPYVTVGLLSIIISLIILIFL